MKEFDYTVRKELAKSPKNLYSFVKRLSRKAATAYRHIYKTTMPPLIIEPVPADESYAFQLTSNSVPIITFSISPSTLLLKYDMTLFGKRYCFPITKDEDVATVERAIAFATHHKVGGGGDEAIFTDEWSSFIHCEGDGIVLTFYVDSRLYLPILSHFVKVQANSEAPFTGEAVTYYIWRDETDEKCNTTTLRSLKFQSFHELKEIMSTFRSGDALLNL